jgi:hypothetical protein
VNSLCGESARRNTIRNGAAWSDSFHMSTVFCVVVVVGDGGGGGDNEDDVVGTA